MNVGPVAAALGAVLVATPAYAGKTQVSGDVGIAAPIDDPAQIGIEAGARLGYRMSFVLVQIAPEIGVHYTTFDDSNAIIGSAGARITVGKIINPGLYGHVGVGTLDDEQGTTLDFGAVIDFTLLPVVDLGIHGGAAQFSNDAGDLTWLTAGAHVSVAF